MIEKVCFTAMNAQNVEELATENVLSVTAFAAFVCGTKLLEDFNLRFLNF